MNEKNPKIIVHEENCTGCLICQLHCSFTYTKAFNPSKSYILVERHNHENSISFKDECNDCGICAKYCLYGALEKGAE